MAWLYAALALATLFALTFALVLLMFKLLDLVERVVVGPGGADRPGAERFQQVLSLLWVLVAALVAGFPIVNLARGALRGAEYTVVPATALLAVLTAVAVYLETGGKKRLEPLIRRGSQGQRQSSS